MRKRYAIALLAVLTALLFAGCRDNMTDDTTSRTSTAEQTTVLPAPEVTLPLDTTPSTGTAKRPAARGPRY